MKFLIWCREHRKLLVINLICLSAFLLLTIISSSMIGKQYSQQEADRWAADGTKYHQVSAFIEEASLVNEEMISEVRSNIQNKLTEASFTEDSVNGRLWIDAYAAKMDSSISKESDSGTAMVENVHVLGVGGDFFQFHPLHMLSGNVFSKEDISQDRVIIDDTTAWTLYGASDIAGKTVLINGRQFVIAGVYRPDSGKYEKMASGKDSYLFMAYESFAQMYPEAGIMSYEAVIPNPVRGFARSTLKQAFGEEEEALADDSSLYFSDKVYVDNTDRFQALTLYQKLWNMPRLLMRTNAVVYPYWENAIRAVELNAIWLLVFRTLFLAIPILSFTSCFCVYVKREYSGFKTFLRHRLSDLSEYMKAKSRARMEKKAAELEKQEAEAQKAQTTEEAPDEKSEVEVFEEPSE